MATFRLPRIFHTEQGQESGPTPRQEAESLVKDILEGVVVQLKAQGAPEGIKVVESKESISIQSAEGSAIIEVFFRQLGLFGKGKAQCCIGYPYTHWIDATSENIPLIEDDINTALTQRKTKFYRGGR